MTKKIQSYTRKREQQKLLGVQKIVRQNVFIVKVFSQNQLKDILAVHFV